MRLNTAFILPGYFSCGLVPQHSWGVARCSSQWPWHSSVDSAGKGEVVLWLPPPLEAVFVRLGPENLKVIFFLSGRPRHNGVVLSLSRPHLPTPLLRWQGCLCFDRKLITCFAGLFSNNCMPWSVSPRNCTNVQFSTRQEWESAAGAEEEDEGNQDCFSPSLEWLNSLWSCILSGNHAFMPQNHCVLWK